MDSSDDEKENIRMNQSRMGYSRHDFLGLKENKNQKYIDTTSLISQQIVDKLKKTQENSTTTSRKMPQVLKEFILDKKIAPPSVSPYAEKHSVSPINDRKTNVNMNVTPTPKSKNIFIPNKNTAQMIKNLNLNNNGQFKSPNLANLKFINKKILLPNENDTNTKAKMCPSPINVKNNSNTNIYGVINGYATSKNASKERLPEQFNKNLYNSQFNMKLAQNSMLTNAESDQRFYNRK